MPLRLVIPRLAIDAPIIAVGLTQDGAMDVPQQASDVGWYEYSQRPGQKGNAVLAGHLDWYGVNGVFWRLAEAQVGDAVIIRGADRQERAYHVEWRRSYPAGDGVAVVGEVFEPLERASLTLITCSGRWNPAAQRYDARVVVRAGR